VIETKRSVLAASIAAAFGGTLLLCSPFQAFAQQAQETQQLERVEITGSSIKRIDGESAAPVQVLKREDIERTGVTSVEQLMRSISSMVSSNSTAVSNASGATTGAISTISMRGLSAERTLILINGKRTAPYGSPSSSVAVDVDSIPIAAIERVEILKDGASAIYGSDAIAGVVNFILRKNYQGTEVSASYGAATKDGKGDVTKASLVTGFGDFDNDRYNFMLVGTYQKEGALYGRDRDFANSSIRLDKDNYSASSRSFPANISIPGFGVYNPAVDGTTGTGNCGQFGTYAPDINPDICLFDTAPFVALIPETERYGLQLSARFAISADQEIYVENGWTHKKVETIIQPSPIDSAFGIPFSMTTANPYYPTTFVQSITGGTTPTLNVRYRPFLIGNRDLTDTADAYRFVLGTKGLLAGWDYDANVLYTASQVKEVLNNGFFRINDDAYGPGIVPLLSGAVTDSSGNTLWVNPFGANSAAVEAAAKATNFVGTAFKTNTSLYGVQTKASKDIGQLPGGAIGLAIGAEFRRETYKLQSAAALSTGNISGYGGNFVPLDTARNAAGIFAEIAAPLTKQTELDGALRFDDYGATTNPISSSTISSTLGSLSSSPSGDTLSQSTIDSITNQSTGNASSFSKATGKLGLRQQISPALLARATLSTGFRAPALLDLYGPVQSGVSAVMDDPKNCQGTNSGNPDFCATQFNIYTGGNSRLKPEKSTSLTFGIVAEPTPGFSIGIDYFRTTVKDMIQILSSSFILQNEAQYSRYVQRGASGEIIAIDQRLENLGEAKINGVDVDARVGWNSRIGKVAVGWSATYMSRWDSQNPDGSYTSNVGTTSGSVSGYIPRLRHTTSATLTKDAWTISGQYNWQAGATDICGNLDQDDYGNCAAGTQHKTSDYETIDAQVEYAGFKNLRLAFGVRNLLDRDPPYVNGNGGAFQSGYDPTYVDPRGRYAYLTASYKFR
jgi:iron complex outermembrane recepter protein